MSIEDFQLLDNEPFDKSIVTRDHLKAYHQQGANLNDLDQNVEFSFGGNNSYHQIGNAHLDVDITIGNTAVVFTNASNIKLMNNALAYCFKEGRLSTTGGSDLEHNKYVRQVGTIMRLLTSKDSYLSSCVDESGESPLNDNNVLERVLINNRIDVIKRKIPMKIRIRTYIWILLKV